MLCRHRVTASGATTTYPSSAAAHCRYSTGMEEATACSQGIWDHTLSPTCLCGGTDLGTGMARAGQTGGILAGEGCANRAGELHYYVTICLLFAASQQFGLFRGDSRPDCSFLSALAGLVLLVFRLVEDRQWHFFTLSSSLSTAAALCWKTV